MRRPATATTCYRDLMGQAARTGMSVFVRGGGDGFAPVHAVVAGIRPSPPVLPFRSATASTSTAPTGPPPPASASFARPKELHRHWLAPYPVTHFLLLFLRSRWRRSPPPPPMLPAPSLVSASVVHAGRLLRLRYLTREIQGALDVGGRRKPMVPLPDTGGCVKPLSWLSGTGSGGSV